MLKTFYFIVSLLLVFNQQIFGNEILKNIRIKHHMCHEAEFDGLKDYIIRDESGLYWYSSNSGLVRFDGNIFSVFEYENFDSRDIKKICSDGNRNIWLLLSKGIWVRFDTRVEDYEYIKLPYNINDIEDIYGYENTVYIVHDNKLSILFNSNNVTTSTCDESLSFEGDFLQLNGYKNHLLILTNKFIYVYNGFSREFREIDYIDIGLNPNQITALHFDLINLLICDTQQNLYKYNLDNNSWDANSIYNSTSLPIEGIIKFQDSKYIAYSKQEIYLLKLLDNSSFTFYSLEKISDLNPYLHKLIDNAITDISYDDLYQSFWIFYNEREVVQVVLSNSNILKINIHNNNNAINNIVEDGLGFIWVATNGSGLYRSTANAINQSLTFEQYHPNDIHTNYHICNDNQANVIVADNLGLIKEYNVLNDSYSNLLSDSVLFTNIKALFVCSKNKLWITTSKAIIMHNLNNNRIEDILYLDIAKDEKASFAEDYLGNIWFGNDEGIWIINQKNSKLQLQKAIEASNAIVLDKIKSIYIDHNNKVIVSYSDGLAIVDALSRDVENVILKTDNRYGEITSIIEDNQGELWYGGKSSILTNSNFAHLLYKYPMSGNEIKVCKLSNGNLVWANNLGIICFNPQKLKQATVHNNIVITDARLINRKDKKMSALSLLNEPVSSTNTINLKSSENSLELFINDANYNEDHNYVYYRVLPKDTTWIPIYNSSFKLLNLNPGKYQLQLKSITPNKFSNEITSINLVLSKRPIFLISIIVIILLVVIVISFIVFICNYYRRQVCFILKDEKIDLGYAQPPLSITTAVLDSVDASDIELDNQLKIVFIEYYKGSLSQLDKLLSKKNKVSIVYNGESAYNMVIKNYPDIIIVDTVGQIKCDFSFYKLIKEELFNCDIPIITYKFLLGELNENDDRINDEDYLNKRIRYILENRKEAELFYLSLLEVASLQSINQTVVTKSEEGDFINEVTEVIYQHLDTPGFNVSRLAEIFNMSQPSFYRKIKLLTNDSIVMLIRKIRMQRASELINTQKYHVKEVAEMIGYNDIPTFRKHFVEFYGVTPTAYIRNIDSYKK